MEGRFGSGLTLDNGTRTSLSVVIVDCSSEASVGFPVKVFELSPEAGYLVIIVEDSLTEDPTLAVAWWGTAVLKVLLIDPLPSGVVAVATSSGVFEVVKLGDRGKLLFESPDAAVVVGSWNEMVVSGLAPAVVIIDKPAEVLGSAVVAAVPLSLCDLANASFFDSWLGSGNISLGKISRVSTTLPGSGLEFFEQSRPSLPSGHWHWYSHGFWNNK